MEEGSASAGAGLKADDEEPVELDVERTADDEPTAGTPAPVATLKRGLTLLAPTPLRSKSRLYLSLSTSFKMRTVSNGRATMSPAAAGVIWANGRGMAELEMPPAVGAATVLLGAATRETDEEPSLSSRSIVTRPSARLAWPPNELIRGAIGAIGAFNGSRFGLSGCRCAGDESSSLAALRPPMPDTSPTSPRALSGEASRNGEAPALLREKLLSGVEDKNEPEAPVADAERLASGVAPTVTPMGATGRLGSSVCFEGVAAAEIFVTPAFEGDDEVAAKIFTGDEDEEEEESMGKTPTAATAVSPGEARGGETSVTLIAGIRFGYGFRLGSPAARMLGLISAAVCTGEVFVGVGGRRTDEVIVERASERAMDTPMFAMGPLEVLSFDSYTTYNTTRSVELDWKDRLETVQYSCCRSETNMNEESEVCEYSENSHIRWVRVARPQDAEFAPLAGGGRNRSGVERGLERGDLLLVEHQYLGRLAAERLLQRAYPAARLLRRRQRPWRRLQPLAAAQREATVGHELADAGPDRLESAAAGRVSRTHVPRRERRAGGGVERGLHVQLRRARGRAGHVVRHRHILGVVGERHVPDDQLVLPVAELLDSDATVGGLGPNEFAVAVETHERRRDADNLTVQHHLLGAAGHRQVGEARDELWRLELRRVGPDGQREQLDLVCRVGRACERDEQVGAGVVGPEQVQAQLRDTSRHVQLVLAAVELRRRRRRGAVALAERHQLRRALRERHAEPVELRRALLGHELAAEARALALQCAHLPRHVAHEAHAARRARPYRAEAEARDDAAAARIGPLGHQLVQEWQVQRAARAAHCGCARSTAAGRE